MLSIIATKFASVNELACSTLEELQVRKINSSQNCHLSRFISSKKRHNFCNFPAKKSSKTQKRHYLSRFKRYNDLNTIFERFNFENFLFHNFYNVIRQL